MRAPMWLIQLQLMAWLELAGVVGVVRGGTRSALAAQPVFIEFAVQGAAAAAQLLGGPVYLHQYKLNCKDPFGKLDFPWHQDFGIAFASLMAREQLPDPAHSSLTSTGAQL